VLLDEPFAGLHKEARSALWKRFLHILDQHPVPVIVVTHYPEELVPRSRLSFYTLRGKPAVLLGETA
jgi:ABC-type molybdenum transport system ATPase subunit/photorepair protein PhrA